MSVARRIATIAAGTALASSALLAAPVAQAQSPRDLLPEPTPAHLTLLPYCEESSLPFFGPIIICHLFVGDVTFSRPW
ncbi:hypothetical protein [Lolliginicoccus levis]|uniref:hypothetical protein n=1 Tax=Lolliginicoccus levis TaxID=2919542 RepID=UPI0024203A5D|nr:hypothetical protein [Lolliginicoccus levis]